MKMPTTRIAVIRARATAEAANYTIASKFGANVPLTEEVIFVVAHKVNAARAYEVDTIFNKCDCPAFGKEGYCKHYAMVQAEVAHEKAIIAEAEYRENEDYNIETGYLSVA